MTARTAIASGDLHWNEHARFSECIRVHEAEVEIVRGEKPDVFLIPGDVFDTASTPRAREAVREHVTRVAEVCPLVISKGNHDKDLDLAIFARHKTKHPIIVEERAAVHGVAGFAIAAVAWPTFAGLAVADRALPAEEAESAGAAALRAMLLGLGNDLDRAGDLPRILLGHFMVDGSIASSGQPLLGRPQNVGVSDLALARAHVGVMGHIHRRQVFHHDGVPFLYTGSPFRTDFGELEEKSVELLVFEGSKLLRAEPIPTPCAPLVHVEAKWTPNGFEYSSDDFSRATKAGSEVRFSYKVPPDQRDAARLAAEDFAGQLRGFGALVGKPEEDVLSKAHARVPEITSARSLVEKLPLVWAAKAKAVSPERAVRLLGKAQQLEKERHDAT